MIVYPNKGRVLWRSALHFLCVLAGIGIVYLGPLWPSLIVGIPILVFLGLGPLGFYFPIVLQAFASSPVLVINDEGIRATIGHVSTLVRWEEINTIDLRKFSTGTTWFEVTLSAEAISSFLSRQSALNRSRRSSRHHSRIVVYQIVLPLSVKGLIEKIQQRYQTPIEHNHIRIRL